MKAFTMLLFSSIICLSIISLNSNKTTGQFEGSTSEFLKNTDYFYNIGFGNWEDTQSLNYP